MTNEEAIKVISSCKHCRKKLKDGTCNEHLINCFEAKRKAIEALEKQVPKKPIKNSEYKDESWSKQASLCPDCKEYVCGLPNYCRDCGRKLDWSDYE